MASEDADMSSEEAVMSLDFERLLPTIAPLLQREAARIQIIEDVIEATIEVVDGAGQTFVIEGQVDLSNLLGEQSTRGGPLPATKESIEAMPTVEITDKGECAICLQEYNVGDKAREMPCKHRFHSNCIEEWLGIHGSCPVCRFEMPLVAQEEDGDSGGGQDGGSEFWMEMDLYHAEAEADSEAEEEEDTDSDEEVTYEYFD